MGQFDKNGGTENFFMSNFDIINLGNEVLAITKIYAQYENAEGQWVNTYGNVETGRRNGFYNYSWNKDNRFNIPPLGQMQLAVLASFISRVLFGNTKEDLTDHFLIL